MELNRTGYNFELIRIELRCGVNLVFLCTGEGQEHLESIAHQENQYMKICSLVRIF